MLKLIKSVVARLQAQFAKDRDFIKQIEATGSNPYCIR